MKPPKGVTNDPPLLLGVDGGGTSTNAWLAAAAPKNAPPSNLGPRVLGRGDAGPSNAKAVGLDRARDALHDAIAAAFAAANLSPRPAHVACIGLAGFDRPDDRAQLETWSTAHAWASRLLLVNDGDLVVAAGTPLGVGVGLIAGTGSIAVGRDSSGQTARAGGWGPLLGDEGSAYKVVLYALTLVCRRADGRDPRPDPDPLTARLLRALSCESPSRLVPAIYAPTMDRTQIAALAPEILAACEDDPTLIPLLLHPAGRALAEQALAVARALAFPPDQPLPLALAGGFLLSAPPVESALLDSLSASGFSPRPTRVPHPAVGALILAQRHRDATPSSTIKKS